MFFPGCFEIGAEEIFNPIGMQLVVAHYGREVEIRVADGGVFPVDQPDGLAANDVAVNEIIVAKGRAPCF